MKYLKFIFALCLIFSLFPAFASAQTLKSDLPQASDSSKMNQKIDYELSYPGILPDHPLYFLKAIRDKTVSFFISNPLKKADFEVLMADKRVLASFLLVQKNKNSLAKDTFSKAENYFEDAITRTKDAKSQGMYTQEIVQKLKLSNSKHQEVFSEIEKTIGKKEIKKWQKERERLKEMEKKVKSLEKK